MRRMCIAALLFAAGCSGGDRWTDMRLKTFPVTGIVRYNDKPFSGAIIIFESQDHDIAAYGASDQNGRFTMRTYGEADGAVAGSHRVRIEKKEEDLVGDPEGRLVRKTRSYLPDRYGRFETSKLIAEVDEDGTEIDFDLRD